MELILSLVYKFPDSYFVATPKNEFVWKKDTAIIKGIYKDAIIKFDNFGARSTSDYTTKSSAILAIGGSTTACYALDQPNTWTALLEQQLPEKYWVGNFGKLGNHSYHHVEQLKHILNYPDLPQVKTVVILMGINDFSAALINQNKYSTLSNYEINLTAFAHLPDSAMPWVRRLSITKLLKKSKNNFFSKFNPDTHGQLLQEQSKKWREAKKIDLLPDLTKGLIVYEQNILKLIEIAHQNKVNLLFISQPVLWHKTLSVEDEKLLYSNKTDGGNYYSKKALVEGIKLFNDRLEQTCLQTNTPFIQSNLASTSINFYDDCHFTEAGAKNLSEQVFEGLKSHQLF